MKYKWAMENFNKLLKEHKKIIESLCFDLRTEAPCLLSFIQIHSMKMSQDRVLEVSIYHMETELGGIRDDLGVE